MKSAQFCPECMSTMIAEQGTSCTSCKVELLLLFHPDRSLTREYLQAKKHCCHCDCAHCPYPEAERNDRRVRVAV
jgi:hypothetical protein